MMGGYSPYDEALFNDCLDRLEEEQDRLTGWHLGVSL